jgi:serine/threonine protein kinase
MAMYSLVHHPNIIPLCGVILKNNCPVSLVLEMQEASLKEVMNAAHISGYYLTMREQIDLAVGLLAGLTYLHELRPDSILHGDVRPTNILVTALMVAKLGDLGAARLTKTSLSVGALSPDYVAPERVPGEVQTPSHNTKAADIYSAGVTIAELFTGKQTGREGRESQRTLIQDQDLFDICGEMESFDPSLRPHAKVALERVQRLYSHSAYEQSPAKRMVRGLLHGSRVVLVNTSCYLLSEI